jgi:tetratricopeptide (TPR) repeat protein
VTTIASKTCIISCRSICLIAVLCLTYIDVKAQAPSPSEDQKYLFSVVPLIEKNQLSQAEDQLVTGIQRYPGSAILHNALGIVYQKQGKIDAAIKAFQSALKSQPSFTAAQLHLAALYQHQGKRRESAELFLAAGEGTANFEALSAAAVGLAQSEEYGDAIRLLEKARNLRPDSASVGYNLAMAHYQREDFQRAFEVLQSLATERADSADIIFLRGLVKQALRQPGSSDDLARACQLQPSTEKFCTDASLALLREKRVDEALNVLQAGLARISSSVPLLSALGLAYFQSGKYQEAIQSYRAVIASGGEAFRAREGLSFLLYVTGQLEQARAIVEEGSNKPGADFYLDHLHALILYRLSPQLWDEAVESIGRVLLKNARFAPSFYLRGKIKLEQNQLDGALEDFQAAASLDPLYPLPYYKMAQILLKQNRHADAERARKKFFELGQLKEEEYLAKQTQDFLLRAAQ